jgi:two-component system, sensor histidine kinase and response regulator
MNSLTAMPGNEDGPSYKVLIVDDDAESLRYVGALLLAHGYRVYAAGSGRLAIDIAREVQPDLVLLDILMPDLSGIDTCRALKQNPATQAIPVIFLTGRADDTGVLEAFAAGGADHIVKPFEAPILLSRVHAHAELGALSRGLERALAERTGQLRAANATLLRLAANLALLEETERARLAGELHDGPLQKLALAQMQLDAGMAPNDDDRHEREQQLATGAALLREATAELRTLQFDLSPPVLHQDGLPAALDWLAGETDRRWGIALRYEGAQDLPAMNRQQSVILFQCARELVHNLIKHAHAASGVIGLSADAEGFLLIVEDDGRGFEPSRNEGYGLYHVRERLKLLGGRLEIESGAAGSRLVMRLPFAPSDLPDQ